MKFKKGSFYIQQIPKATEQFVLKTGWLSEDGQFGFHKNGTKWVATDIATGAQLFTFTTRAECARAIELMMENIMIARTYERNYKAAEAMKEFCKKDLE